MIETEEMTELVQISANRIEQVARTNGGKGVRAIDHTHLLVAREVLVELIERSRKVNEPIGQIEHDQILKR